MGRTDSNLGGKIVYNKSNLVPSTTWPGSEKLHIKDLAFRGAVLPRMITMDRGGSDPIPESCVQHRLPEGRNFTRPLQHLADNSTFLQCTLVNSTYNVAFEYVNGSQAVQVEVPPTSRDAVIAAMPYVWSTAPPFLNCSGFFWHAVRDRSR